MSGYNSSDMDATTTYRREVLEFIVGPAEFVSPSGNDDAQASASLRWPCGCIASGEGDVYRISPCGEHRSEFDGTEDAPAP